MSYLRYPYELANFASALTTGSDHGCITRIAARRSIYHLYSVANLAAPDAATAEFDSRDPQTPLSPTAASATNMSDEAATPTQTPDWEEIQQGVRKCITKEGTNPKVYAAPGMEVCVHYTGTLPGSTEPFD